MLEYNFDTLFAKVDRSLKPFASDKNLKRDILKVWFSIDENLTIRFLYQTSAGRKYPFLSNFNIGISPNIRNMNGYWSSGIRIGLSYRFMEELAASLDFETSYMFTSAQKADVYEWVDLSIFTFGEKKVNGGLSLGYLINEKEVVFNKNNFRLGFPIGVSKYIIITPEFYFNDFFKATKEEDRYFAVKISLGL